MAEHDQPLSPRSVHLHQLVTNLQVQVEQMRLEQQRLLAYQQNGSSDHGSEEERPGGGGGRHRGGAHRGRRRGEDKMEGVKIKIPSFIGKNDPEAYLEWELKMEQVFECNQFNERKKVKMAAIEFKEYALVWWDQHQKDRRRIGDEPVETWEEMKLIMRRRFVPSSYQRDIHNKLQRLTQGSNSVDDYFKEMEMALLRSNFQEDREATMARFLHGLNQDIQDIVELQNYVELDDLVQQAIKVEQQLKRRKSKMSTTSNSKYSSSSWKEKPKKEGEPSKEAVGTPQMKKAVDASTTTKSREVKCFKCLGHGHIASQCPTKRTMVMLNGEVESQSEASSGEEDEEDMSIPNGDFLMVRRLLGSQVKGSENNQRENLFHSRCLVQGKLCSLIIDGGSCANIVSARLVSKLNLVTKEHPTPYKLQWLSEEGEMEVNQQVEVPFTIDKYEDVVLCDVVPMEASHVLLGRPWQFDKKALHDGFSNKISFMHKDNKIVLSPLSPSEVREDKKN